MLQPPNGWYVNLNLNLKVDAIYEFMLKPVDNVAARSYKLHHTTIDD